MRTRWIVFLTVTLVALVARANAPVHARSGFEVYADVGYAGVTATEKEGGNSSKVTAPGLALGVGGRYWFGDTMAAGLLLDVITGSAESQNNKYEASSTGFVGTFSYRFTGTERMEVLGTLGVGSFTGKAKRPAYELKGKSAVGFLAGLELRSALSERARLTGKVGYRTVNYSKVERDGTEVKGLKLDTNAFTVTAGLTYAF